MAKVNIYVIFDKIADDTIIIGTAKTDGLFIRQNMPYLNKLNPAYMSECEVLHVGSYVESEKRVEPCDPRLIPWDAYQRPEQKEADFSVSAPVANKNSN